MVLVEIESLIRSFLYTLLQLHSVEVVRRRRFSLGSTDRSSLSSYGIRILKLSIRVWRIFVVIVQASEVLSEG